MSRKRAHSHDVVYNPPPDWPREPPPSLHKNWTVPPGWTPDPKTVPPAPDGWQFWVAPGPLPPRRPVSFYMKAGAAVITFVATVTGVLIAILELPASYTLADWSTKANAACEQDFSQQNVPMLRSILTLQNLLAADQRSQSGSEQAILGIASSADAFRKLIGDLRALQVPGGDGGEINQLLDRGETIFSYLTRADANIQNGLNPAATGAAQDRFLLSAISTLQELNAKALPPWRRSLRTLSLRQCPYLSGGAVTPAVVTAPGRRWSFTTGGSVESSPAVSGTTVYVGSNDGELYALDAATGQLRWTFATGSDVWSSPAVAAGSIFVGSNNGTVYALSAANGKRRWGFATGKIVDSSPAVSGNSVYVGSDNGRIYALDAATGHPRWSFTTGSPIDSSPAVAGHAVYIGSNNGTIYALNTATGHLRWSFATGSDIWSRPAVSGGTVYIGSRNDNVYALDATTGHLRWSFATGNVIYSSPAISSGTVYIGSRDHKLYALSATTGHLRWSFTTGSSVQLNTGSRRRDCLCRQ